MRLLIPVAALPLLLVPLAAPADDVKVPDDGFVPLFNGKDLTGWVNVNCAPDTFTVKDGEIVTTGKPTGYLRTDRQYENFIAEFDWMHVPPKPGAVGNSGFFVWADPIPAVGTGYTRGIEVQVLVNLTYKNKKGEVTATSQGDLFSIWGAHCTPDRPHPEGRERCLPSGEYCKGENEWNHYCVEANDGRITLAVNGHEVSGVSKCNPRKGYLALESEGSECHFKNLKIKELPSTNPKPEEVADEAQGHKPLYTGLDLSGWKADDEAKKHWQPKDTVLHYDGKDDEKGQILWTAKEYADCELIVDWRLPDKSQKKGMWELLPHGSKGVRIEVNGPKEDTERVYFYGGLNGSQPWDCAYRTAKKPIGEWNRLEVRVKGEELVVRNYKQGDRESFDVPEGLAAKGPIGLRSDGAPVEFANIMVRELK
jgi:3-keto-disaccharide hydrolase